MKTLIIAIITLVTTLSVTSTATAQTVLQNPDTETLYLLCLDHDDKREGMKSIYEMAWLKRDEVDRPEIDRMYQAWFAISNKLVENCKQVEQELLSNNKLEESEILKVCYSSKRGSAEKQHRETAQLLNSLLVTEKKIDQGMARLMKIMSARAKNRKMKKRTRPNRP